MQHILRNQRQEKSEFRETEKKNTTSWNKFKTKLKTLIKRQGEKKTFLPEKSNSTKLPPTQQKDKF